VGQAGAMVNARWASGDDNAMVIMPLQSSCCCCHCVVVVDVRECGEGRERAGAGASWANGHNDGVMIVTA